MTDTNHETPQGDELLELAVDRVDVVDSPANEFVFLLTKSDGGEAVQLNSVWETHDSKTDTTQEETARRSFLTKFAEFLGFRPATGDTPTPDQEDDVSKSETVDTPTFSPDAIAALSEDDLRKAAEIISARMAEIEPQDPPKDDETPDEAVAKGDEPNADEPQETTKDEEPDDEADEHAAALVEAVSKAASAVQSLSDRMDSLESTTKDVSKSVTDQLDDLAERLNAVEDRRTPSRVRKGQETGEDGKSKAVFGGTLGLRS